MKIHTAELKAVGVSLKQYPQDEKKEIAFVGKSNVGKSSLINKMLGRKKLARTSGQPGKTRTINFYSINDLFYLVDLPGYGYAKASKTDIAKWGQMVEEYLYQRDALRGVVLLIDMRHEPGANDIQMYQWLKHYGYKMVIVLTKMDKLKRSQWQKQISMIKKQLQVAAEDTVVACSAETGDGIEELWENLESILDE